MIEDISARWIHWLKLTLGRTPAADDSDRRFVAVVRGAGTALGARGVAVLTGFAVVPLLLRSLGAERYGAWVTIASTIGWLSLADLGLGNGLTNALSEAYGKRDLVLAQRHVATAFWLLAGIAAAGGLLFAALFPNLDWAGLLNVHSALARGEVANAAALAVAFFLLALPLGVIDRVYAAWQEGAVANLWAAAASVAALLGLVVATRAGGGMGLLVLAFAGGRFVVQAASGAWLFFASHPELRPAPAAFERTSRARLSSSGGLFFVIQIAALVLFNTDNIVIARVLGPEQVTPYSVTWTLFTLPSMAFSLAFPFLWPAYAEAFARRDPGWIRRTFRKSLLVSLAVGVSIAAPLVAVSRPLIALWAGEAAVPPLSVPLWMGLWSLVHAGLTPVACLLNAAGQLRSQAIAASLSALVNVGLSIAWARRYGIAGVISATVVSYLLVAAVPICIEAARTLSRFGMAGGSIAEGGR